MSRSLCAIGRATTRSTERPITRGTPPALPAARPAAAPRHSPQGSCRLNWVPTLAARCAAPHIFAASSRTSRPWIWCPNVVPSRRSCRQCRCAVTLPFLGPMARTAADLALALAVVAGPDELAEGIGYKLALPTPRHDKLSDYRVLVLDKHPLCPTAASITEALNRLAERIGKTGCTVLRGSAKLPDLARTTQIYCELLAAVYSADQTPEDSARFEAAAKALPAEDQSLDAYRLRGIAANHAEWIRASRVRTGLRGRWFGLFQDVDVVLCPPMP